MDDICQHTGPECAATAGGDGSLAWWEHAVQFWTNYGSYKPRTHCVVGADGRPDWPWIGALVFLTALVVVAYAKTFIFWRRCFLEVAPQDRNRKLMELAWVFAMCAICGYVMSIVSFIWPAYRLLTILMAVLVACSWRFAWSLNDFRVSFSARRLERELRESLTHRAEELEVLVSIRTRELEEARREADAANEAKSAFLANMSHEIRTPMTAILGFSELLRSDDLEQGEKAEYLELVRKHGEHLLALINDILDLSKIEAGSMTLERIAFDPGMIARDVCALMRPRAQAKSLDVVLDIGDGFPTAVMGDPTRLKQILLNLVGNAVKFTSSGSVRVVCRGTGEAAGAGSTGPATTRLVFEVVDTGIGIAEDKLGSIFSAFTQADVSTTRRFGGSGLGLSISRRLAGAMGGDLTVASRVGTGSTFTLTVPAEAAPRGTVLENDEHEMQGVRDVLAPQDRILVADDSPDNQRLISRILEKAGATVEVASNGEEAVAAARRAAESGRPYGLVLMDVDMPVMDGIAAAQEIKAGGLSTTIIAVTAHAMAVKGRAPSFCGFDGQMTKPVDRRALVQACVTALRAGRNGNGSLANAA